MNETNIESLIKEIKSGKLDRTDEENDLYLKFVEVWGPIFALDPCYATPLENFLFRVRKDLPKPACFGLDDCSTLMLSNCKVAPLCGKT